MQTEDGSSIDQQRASGDLSNIGKGFCAKMLLGEHNPAALAWLDGEMFLLQFQLQDMELKWPNQSGMAY